MATETIVSEVEQYPNGYVRRPCHEGERHRFLAQHWSDKRPNWNGTPLGWHAPWAPQHRGQPKHYRCTICSLTVSVYAARVVPPPTAPPLLPRRAKTEAEVIQRFRRTPAQFFGVIEPDPNLGGV
jgi:hypothetical protein